MAPKQSKHRHTASSQSTTPANIKNNHISESNGIETIISAFNAMPGLELEVRFYDVDYNAALLTINTFMKEHGATMVDSKFIDAIEDYETHRNRMRLFVDQPHGNDGKYVMERTKKQLLYKDRKTLYNISLSSETPISSDDFSNDFMTTHFTRRFSFEHPTNKAWRVDISIIKEVSPQHNNIQSVIHSYFDKYDNYEDLREEITKNPYNYKYQIEIEYIGAPILNKNMTMNRADNAKQIKSPSEIDSVVNDLLSISNSDGNNSVQYIEALKCVAEVLKPEENIAPYVRAPTTKYILPQVKILTKTDFGEIDLTKYMVTDKADGFRCIAMINDKKCVLLYTVYEDIKCPGYKGKMSIADGEYFPDKKMLLLFDVLMYEGESYVKSILPIRIDKLKLFAEAFSIHSGIQTIAKEYKTLTKPTLRASLTEAFNKKRDYSVDGLIFTEIDAPYTSAVSWKWKSSENQTIDFHAKRCPPESDGKYPYLHKEGIEKYSIYLLFVTITKIGKQRLNIDRIPEYLTLYPEMATSNDFRIPIQFTTPLHPLAYIYYHKDSLGDINNKIVELAPINVTDDRYIDWKFVKVREDKSALQNASYGNSYDAALHTLSEFIDPLTFEMLYMGTDQYFMVKKDDIYKPLTIYNSYVKTLHINSITNTSTLIDISSGKGQDLFRYIGKNIDKLIVCDNDKNAIVQLMQRWLGLARQDAKNAVMMNTKLTALIMDVNSDANINMRRIISIYNSKFDNLICNFAIHYFSGSLPLIRNFASLCAGVTNRGAVIQFTCLDGKKVCDLLRGNNIVDMEENGVIKYSIKKMYKGDDIEPCSQKIAVIHPFSAGRHIEEYLVNFDTFISVFQEYGMTLTENRSFMYYFTGFRDVNREMCSKITETDKKYISLYSVIKFTKQ